MKIDAHQDLLYFLSPFSVPKDIGQEYQKAENQISLEKIKESSFDIIFSSIFPEPEFYRKGRERIFYLLSIHKKFLEKNKNFYLLEKVSDFQKDKKGLLLHIEGYYGKIDDLDELYRQGIRSLSLTWNKKNQYAGGVESKAGLTKEGKKLVKEIARRNIILDLAHLNERSFWDVLETYKKPPLVTHTACYSLCANSRNLKDEQIKAIAKRGGVIGVFFSSKFLIRERISTIENVVNHISYIANLVGIDYVGIGSDFGGIISGVPKGLEDVRKITNLEKVLIQEGFNKREVEKILGNNFLRVLKKILK